MKRLLSAPGKLFLTGEYAVLWGGAARVVAVGPRGKALVHRRDDREVEIVLEEGRLRGTLTPLGVRWRDEVTSGFRFAARAVDAAVAAHGQEVLGFSLALSPSEPAVAGHKPGLGGSARATVLAVEAVRYVLEARFDTLKLALWAHAKAQGMKGSGGDVAASFAGGLLRYRRYEVEALAQGGQSLGPVFAAAPAVDLRRLQLPELHLTYAFAGQSASTERLIGKVEDRLDLDARFRFAARSDALGDALESALLARRFEEIREGVEEIHALLCTLGPLETEGIRQIVALARSLGSVAKLSGAGGGDGCVAFSPDAATQATLVESLRARNIPAFPLTPEPGLRGEVEPDAQLGRWIA